MRLRFVSNLPGIAVRHGKRILAAVIGCGLRFTDHF